MLTTCTARVTGEIPSPAAKSCEVIPHDTRNYSNDKDF